MFFSKSEIKQLELPFQYTYDEADFESGCVTIKVQGEVLGQQKFCYSSYCLTDGALYQNKGFEEIIELLKNPAKLSVKVNFKIKKGLVKDYKIDIPSLVETFNDERFSKLELAGWGMFDEPKLG